MKRTRFSPLGGSTRFNQVFEVPKLEKWFKSDPSPSRQRLIYYMNELNASQHRRSHPKITYQQMCNWFSNARATRKRPNSSSVNVGIEVDQVAEKQKSAELASSVVIGTRHQA